MLEFEVLGLTDTGCVRNHNEDAFLVHRFQPEKEDRRAGILAVVADGVGGHAGGRQASQTCVEKIRYFLEEDLNREPGEALLNAIEKTHRFLKQMSQENPLLKGMGTTCTVVWVIGSEAYFAQVGDSRAYLFRNQIPIQITEDQTLVQKLFREGKIREQEIPNHPDRNIILQALGISDPLKSELFHLKLEPGDTLLLSTDGLHGLVKDREMVDLSNSLPLAETIHQLIALARKRGGHDNITAVILNVFEGYDPQVQAGQPDENESAGTKKHAVFFSEMKRCKLWLKLLLVLFFAVLTAILIMNPPINIHEQDLPLQKTE